MGASSSSPDAFAPPVWRLLTFFESAGSGGVLWQDVPAPLRDGKALAECLKFKLAGATFGERPRYVNGQRIPPVFSDPNALLKLRCTAYGLRMLAQRQREAIAAAGAAHAGSAAPPADKTEGGERKGGAGSTPGQPADSSGTQRKTIFCQLKPAVRKAYLANQYAETMNGRRLGDRESHNWLKENGIDPENGDLGELTDYEPTDSLNTFRRYLGTARNALDENEYTPRGERTHGGSIARGNAIEYQKGDEE